MAELWSPQSKTLLKAETQLFQGQSARHNSLEELEDVCPSTPLDRETATPPTGQPPLVDGLFAAALLNRNHDPSHISHYNTVVEAQALVNDLETCDALTPDKPPAKASRMGKVGDGLVPKLILQETTLDDKEKQLERLKMVRQLCDPDPKP